MRRFESCHRGVKRSRAVTLSVTLMLTATLLGACNDDDDCDDESLPRIEWTQGMRQVDVGQAAPETLPAKGGFGTRMDDCGG